MVGATGGLTAGGIALIVAFFVMFGLVVRGGLSVQKKLIRWVEAKAREGWEIASSAQVLLDQGWHWFDALYRRRRARVDRLAVNRGGGELEAEFMLLRSPIGGTLQTRSGGPRMFVGNQLGCGVVVRLPKPVDAPFLCTPWTGGVGFFRWAMSLDLPEIDAGDERFDQQWDVFTTEPDRVAQLLRDDERLRDALIAIAEEDVGRRPPKPGKGVQLGPRPKYLTMVVEFRGDLCTLIGAPALVGRNLFEDLEHTAATLVEKLR